MVASSRWDALKPNAPNHHPTQHHTSQLQHYNKQQPIHNNRSNNGRRSGAGHKKGGRPQQQASDSFFSKTTVTRHASPTPPVSPPSLVNQANTLPLPSSLPPPPPGLGPLPLEGGGPVQKQPLKPNNNSESLLLPCILQSSNWNTGISLPPRQQQQPMETFVSQSFLNTTNASTPTRFGTHSQQYSPAGSIPFGATLKENPFAPDNEQANRESQIEADLQELGGQMAGSILDF
jgi:hypothetical protein